MSYKGFCFSKEMKVKDPQDYFSISQEPSHSFISQEPSRGRIFPEMVFWSWIKVTWFVSKV